MSVDIQKVSAAVVSCDACGATFELLGNDKQKALEGVYAQGWKPVHLTGSDIETLCPSCIEQLRKDLL